MNKSFWVMLPACSLMFLGLIFASLIGMKTITTISYNQPLPERNCFIIDAGHGGVDGGAVSCTGAYESKINLEISLRLNDLMHLIGYETKMIRTEDISVYTEGESIAAKKSSDLKERVRIVNETQRGILLSIHQNYFYDSFYSGGQMFFSQTAGSKELSKQLQDAFISYLNPGSNRKEKSAEGIYLMKHITNPGVLIECGFLSNYEEEAKLRSADYQKKLCCVISSVCSQYLLDRVGES